MPSAVRFSTATKQGGSLLPKTYQSTTVARNSVLAQLTTADYSRLEPSLEQVPLIFNSVIYELGAPIDYVYFPESGVLSMLGVRNQAVSVAAISLQDAGLIEYSRRTINILDRSNLEAVACDCYRVITAQTGSS